MLDVFVHAGLRGELDGVRVDECRDAGVLRLLIAGSLLIDGIFEQVSATVLELEGRLPVELLQIIVVVWWRLGRMME